MTCITAIKLQYSSKKSSTILTYSLRIISVYALLINTILTIPFFNSFFAVIYCSRNSPIHKNLDCYNGLYFLHLSMAILGLIIFISFSLLFTFLYIDLNPNSSIPFACSQSQTILFKLFLKFILPLYSTIDYDVNFTYIIFF